MLSVYLLLALSSGCGHNPYQVYLPPDGQVIEDVHVGDTVDVFLHDHTQHTFEVFSVDKYGLHGESISLAYDDIESIVVRGKPYHPILNLLSRGPSF